MMNAYPFRASFLPLALLSGLALLSCKVTTESTPGFDAGPSDCELDLSPSDLTLAVGASASVVAAVYYRAEGPTDTSEITWAAAGGEFANTTTMAMIIATDGGAAEPLSAAAATNTLTAKGPPGTYTFTVGAATSTGCFAGTQGTLVVK